MTSTLTTSPLLPRPLALRRSMLLGVLAWTALPAKPAYAAADAVYAGFAVISDVHIDKLAAAKGSEMAAFALRRAQAADGRAPQPLATLHTQGTLAHQGVYDQSSKAKQDWAAALDLALGARLSGNRQWHEQAAKILAAWLQGYQSSFNPIDDAELYRLFLAFDLLAAQFKASIFPVFVEFSRRLATGYLDRMPRLKGGTATNNWQSHRVKLATLAAFMSGERSLIDAARRAFAKQLSDNITADGSVIDFYRRDALHYVVYDLEPLLMSALAAKTHGEDWYELRGSTGAGLKQALRWLEPYAMGLKTHQEFANTTVRFDRERAAASLTGFSGLWEPFNAQDTYALAARLDPDFIALSHKLTPGFTGERRPTSPWLDLTMPV